MRAETQVPSSEESAANTRSHVAIPTPNPTPPPGQTHLLAHSLSRAVTLRRIPALAHRANAFLRDRPQLARAARAVTRPVRQAGIPVLTGAGRGLRVSVGESTLLRLVSRVEPTVEDAILARLGRGDVVWDVGANIGWFSLLAARRVGPEGRVTAFEPNQRNAEQVRRNATRNDLTIEVVEAAVSGEAGWARFDAGSSLMGRLRDDGTLRVPTVTLDGWAASHAAPTFIKLDIEGAEVGALQGATRLLSEAHPTILCECHATQVEVDAILWAAGYRVTPVEMPGVPVDQAPWWVHLLAEPS